MEQSLLTPAERMYKKHKENVLAYQRKNPDKIKEKNRVYLAKVKDDPVAFEEFKKKRREYEKKWRATKKAEVKKIEVEIENIVISNPPLPTLTARREENEVLRQVTPARPNLRLW